MSGDDGNCYYANGELASLGGVTYEGERAQNVFQDLGAGYQVTLTNYFGRPGAVFSIGDPGVYHSNGGGYASTNSSAYYLEGIRLAGVVSPNGLSGEGGETERGGNTSPWDTNGDGKLQKGEADNWFMNGNGNILVNGKYIDLGGLSTKDLKFNPKTKIYSLNTLKAFKTIPLETASTYGGSCFVLNNGQFQMLSQDYHYNIRPWNSWENIGRNLLTILGRPSSMGVTPSGFNQFGGKATNEGKPYTININY